ncbi:hypothetical protein TKK_0008790 [Trichogramma kaykai]
MGDDVTLEKIIAEANAWEAVQRQLMNYDPNELSQTAVSVNRIETKDKRTNLKACTRCGSLKHQSDYEMCAARYKKCLKCGFLGHFRSQCRTKATKRKSDIPPYNDKRKQYKTKDQESVDYIFNINDDDEVIICNIGGVNTEMIIDSGSKCNILSDTAWENLKQNKVKVLCQTKTPNRTFMAYAG